MHEILATAMVLGARKDRGVRFFLTWHLKVKNGIFQVRSQVKSKYHYAKICVFWVTKFKFWLQHFTWNSRFGIQNVQLGKIWPRRFNGLAKTKLEPKFEVSISKNIDLAQQCTLQKVWKILLLTPFGLHIWSTFPIAFDHKLWFTKCGLNLILDL